MIAIDVAARHRRFHHFDQCLQFGGLRGRALLRRSATGELIEHGANLEDIVGLLDADLADEHAAVLLEPDETGFLERAKCFAHGPARDAEHRRHLGFAQLRARREIAREDHPLDFALDKRRKRVRLQQRDRVVVGNGA